MIEAGALPRGYHESVGNKHPVLSPGPSPIPSHSVTTATHPCIGADVGINGVTRNVAFKETEKGLLCQDLGCTSGRPRNRRTPRAGSVSCRHRQLKQNRKRNWDKPGWHPPPLQGCCYSPLCPCGDAPRPSLGI